ncbi:precorrin-3B synthase [Solirhodobacter olei]|uniref:precorrin-3B synthase n=1 Tax=Solirhodobacter olei TaxID=2493082 RepID=UPI000FD9D379|nr:precorrin-3B synthase [Solirhodobacter olei]
MSEPEIRGWCPGALTPMASADGLVVRLRPPLGCLSPPQARAVAAAAVRFGPGEVELTSRASLQIRGVAEADHAALLAELAAHGLVDPDPETERARAIAIAPFYGEAAEIAGLANSLTEALRAAPLPAKFGATLDTSPAPVLAETAADIRLERAADGRLVLRPDGSATGKPVTAETLPEALAELIDWFLATGGARNGRGRMRKHLAENHALPAGYDVTPAPPAPLPAPGTVAGGQLVVVAFGLLPAETLSALAELAEEIRLTPWRGVFLPGLAALPALPGLLTDPEDPLLRVHACTGRPGCPQALAETRTLARALAPRLTAGQSLHVSGCAKGCAHPGRCGLVLTATPEGFDLARDTSAGAPPLRRALSPAALLSTPDPFGAP